MKNTLKFLVLSLIVLVIAPFTENIVFAVPAYAPDKPLLSSLAPQSVTVVPVQKVMVREGYTVINPDNSKEALQDYAAQLLNNDTEFTCLKQLWTKESGWNYEAKNDAFAPSKEGIPENQAYGIPQAGPGLKMATAGPDWKTSPRTQIDWGLDYIKSSYGTPCSAWDHSTANNWY